jgi:colanic acid biosynthesis glycosyl transferase WcaI
MPSKLSTILSIGGLAIITAPPNSSLFETVSKNKMSILIEPENHELLEKTILDTLYSDNRQLRHNAFKYANKYLGKELILTNFLNHLMQPVNSEVSEQFVSS